MTLVLAVDTDQPHAEDIFKALGQLALAASQAEAFAAQGLYYLLTDRPGDEEGASRISGEFRSFDSLYKLLSIALRCETPLSAILESARVDAQRRDTRGEPQVVAVLAEVARSASNMEYLDKYASQHPSATAVTYLNSVKALYDKRNECLHALGIEVVDSRAHLHKRRKDGTKVVVNAEHLMEPCQVLRHYPGIELSRAITAVSLELTMASLPLVGLPITVQWFRRKGTALDYAPLIDHYVALAVKPLDEQLELLKKIETSLQSKIDAYHAGRAEEPSDLT
jgi:hypothetical protein